jgi:hypothetical protein
MTPSELKAFPLCGIHLVPTREGNAYHPNVSQREAMGHKPRFCFIQGSHIGSELFDFWQTRIGSGGGISYEVVEGLPVFNNLNQGTPVTPEFLNDCFNFIRGKSNGY